MYVKCCPFFRGRTTLCTFFLRLETHKMLESSVNFHDDQFQVTGNKSRVGTSMVETSIHSL